MKAAVSLFLLVALSGCASQDAIRPFALDERYTERMADPGKVDNKCYTPGGRMDDGRYQKWNDSYCGCVDHANKTIWIARSIHCNADKVREHEYCHIRLGSSPEARKICHSNYKPA